MNNLLFLFLITTFFLDIMISMVNVVFSPKNTQQLYWNLRALLIPYFLFIIQYKSLHGNFGITILQGKKTSSLVKYDVTLNASFKPFYNQLTKTSAKHHFAPQRKQYRSYCTGVYYFKYYERLEMYLYSCFPHE